MASESRKYFSAFLSFISSLAAAASIGIFYKNIGLFSSSEFFAIMAGVVAVVTAAASAVYMRQILKRQSLRRQLRRVFIIYAKEDLSRAREIANLLRKHDLEPWLDVEKIEAGQIWKDAINAALDESAIAVVLSSENLAKSSTAMEELNRAISRMESSDNTTSPVIPVKIDKADIPSAISHIQYVDMTAEDASEFLIKSLEGAMRRILGAYSESQRKSA